MEPNLPLGRRERQLLRSHTSTARRRLTISFPPNIVVSTAEVEVFGSLIAANDNLPLDHTQ